MSHIVIKPLESDNSRNTLYFAVADNGHRLVGACGYTKDSAIENAKKLLPDVTHIAAFMVEKES